MSARGQIIASARDMLAAKLGPNAAGIFREVRKGPWHPTLACSRPCLWVCDVGQTADKHFDDALKLRLKMLLVLDLEDDFTNPASFEKWQGVVDLLIEVFEQWNPLQFSRELIEYVDDDPMEVTFQSGSSRYIWTLNEEIVYMRHFGKQ